ncbi:MAG: ceramidase domain-containing protein [Elusimicrobia bacterium]|nr:ceramidase domain-containing protein [Elusimicrobiota bacterium]
MARGALTLVAISAAAALAVFLHAPIPQDQAYHAFADVRPLFGLPNFGDVMSNAAFLAVGLYGLRRKPLMNRPAYTTLCAGVLLVSLGSAYYHQAPSDATLLWDRLPMTVAFMALFSMMLEERVTSVKTLPVLLALGIASALYWRETGDLRAYMLVQFLPLVLLPLILLLFPRKYLDGRLLMVAVAFYVLAKALETYDRQVFSSIGIVSGHTLKHLSAGVASFFVIAAVPAKPAG